MMPPPTVTADARARRGGPRTMWKALVPFRYEDQDGIHEVLVGKVQTYVHMSHPICRKFPDRFMPVNMRDEHRAAREKRLRNTARVDTGPSQTAWRLPARLPRESWRLP
jgi:hypothetical protein